MMWDATWTGNGPRATSWLCCARPPAATPTTATAPTSSASCPRKATTSATRSWARSASATASSPDGCWRRVVGNGTVGRSPQWTSAYSAPWRSATAGARSRSAGSSNARCWRSCSSTAERGRLDGPPAGGAVGRRAAGQCGQQHPGLRLAAAQGTRAGPADHAPARLRAPGRGVRARPVQVRAAARREPSARGARAVARAAVRRPRLRAVRAGRARSAGRAAARRAGGAHRRRPRATAGTRTWSASSRP